MEHMAPSTDLSNIKLRYQYTSNAARQTCMYTIHNLYLKYLHISPPTSQTEGSAANVCPQSSHVLLYLLMCNSA